MRITPESTVHTENVLEVNSVTELVTEEELRTWYLAEVDLSRPVGLV